MLTDLTVRNLVIVEQARLTPGQGLTVISGETGAGKSLLLDALDLLRGGRANAGLVGPRGDETTVVGVFSLEPERAAAVEQACGVAAQDGQVIMRRRITKAGRSQAWINDMPVTVTALAAAAGCLMEIRAQNEAQRLGDPARQLALLDAYAGLTAQADAYRAVHSRVLDLAARLDAIEKGGRDSLKELDFLRFQAEEFRALDPKPGELAELESRLTLLSDATRWRDLAARAADQLSDGDRAAVRIIAGLVRQLADAPDPHLAEAARTLDQARELVLDAGRTCADAAERLHADPAELARCEERRDAFYALMRKHGDGEDTLLAAWRTIDERITALEGLDGERDRLAAELTRARDERATLGAALAKSRASAFAKLAKATHAELTELGMPKAKLSLADSPLPEPTLLGTVRQEFLVTANPGLPPAPLGATASGGEAARITLALTVALAAVDKTPVLVFDEVDSGVGGRLGAAIGGRLARLGAGRSVLAVTHTPQVAAAAARHYRVSKRHGRDETMVDVDEMTGSTRMAELADMLGGGHAALAQAKALLGASEASA